MPGAALVAVVLAIGAGCGDDGEAAGDAESLSWAAEPRRLVNPDLPGEVILAGEIGNGSDEPIELAAADIRVLDDEGVRLESSAVFSTGYVKPIEGLNRPDTLAEEDLDRLGRTVTIGPESTAPLTVSWREPARREGSELRVGGTELPLP